MYEEPTCPTPADFMLLLNAVAFAGGRTLAVSNLDCAEWSVVTAGGGE